DCQVERTGDCQGQRPDPSQSRAARGQALLSAKAGRRARAPAQWACGTPSTCPESLPLGNGGIDPSGSAPILSARVRTIMTIPTIITPAANQGPASVRTGPFVVGDLYRFICMFDRQC